MHPAPPLSLLNSNLFDVHIRLNVENFSLSSQLGYNPIKSATWTASVDQLAVQGNIVLHRGVFGPEPLIGMNGTIITPIFADQGQSALGFMMPTAGRFFELQTAVCAKGAAPAAWVTMLDGRIDGCDSGGAGEEATVSVRDMMGCWLNHIIEPEVPPSDVNGFMVPSGPLGAWLGSLRDLAYPDSGANVLERELAARSLVGDGAPDWTVVDTWVPFGANLAEKMNEAVLQRGWAFKYVSRPRVSGIGAFVYYDPVRSPYFTDAVVEPSHVIRVTKCMLNDQDVTNVWDLIYGRGADRARIRQVGPESIIKYGRRYGSWPEPQASSMDTNEEASRMVAAMLLDTQDPIVELDYERLYYYPVELGDKHVFLANNIETGIDLDLTVIGYTHTISQKSMRTVVRTRGNAVAARRRYRRGEHQMVHVGVDPVPVEIAPEGAIYLPVTDLDPP